MRRRNFAALGSALPALWEGRGVLPEALKALHDAFPGQLLAVCDANTLAAAPADLPLFQLPGTPKADEEYAAIIIEQLDRAMPAALIAIGSGTVNDLCKYAAHQRGLPYAAIATAPSMNGYASANASMTMGGYKTTLPCRAPQIIVADWDILAAAPRRMVAAGFADAICRCTAQADWLLSHLLLGTPYRPELFTMQRATEDALLQQLDALATGEPEATGLLMEWLVLGGIAMNLAGGSYPASQGEHLIAHACDMMELAPSALHGELVAVAMLDMAEHQQKMLSKRHVSIKGLTSDIDAMLQERLGPSVSQSCIMSYRKKQAQLPLAKTAIKDWAQVTAVIGPLIRNPETLRQNLAALGAPTRPEDIGISPNDFSDAKTAAPYLRDRFTFLDIA